MIDNFKQFNENSNIQVVDFHDLEKDWNVDRIVNAENGLYPYMVKDGMWVRKDHFTQSEYPKMLYSTPEDIEKLNNLRKELNAKKEEYSNFLNSLNPNRDKKIPYSFP